MGLSLISWCRMGGNPGINFNLMDQLTFYGSYHTRPGNQAIHFVFVPLIIWTVTVWLAYAPAPIPYDLPAHLGFLPEAIARCSALMLLPLCHHDTHLPFNGHYPPGRRMPCACTAERCHGGAQRIQICCPAHASR